MGPLLVFEKKGYNVVSALGTLGEPTPTMFQITNTTKLFNCIERERCL